MSIKFNILSKLSQFIQKYNKYLFYLSVAEVLMNETLHVIPVQKKYGVPILFFYLNLNKCIHMSIKIKMSKIKN